MHVSITCPECGFRFKVQGRFAGRRGRCPSEDCSGVYQVPHAPARREREVAPAAGPKAPRKRVPKKKSRSRVSETPPPPPQAGRQLPIWQRTPFVWAAGLAVALLVVVSLGAVLLRTGPGEARAAADPKTADAKTVEREVALKKRDERLTADFEKHVAPFLSKYCNDCHGDADGEGGLDFTKYKTAASIREDRTKWEDVVSMLGIRAMPPIDHDPQPTAAEREAVLAWAGEALGVDCSIERDPGRVTIRRLNRKEYANTIRDLVGVNFDPAEDFPSDDVGYGFDNIGDVLSLPPLLLEKYVDAAERITQASIDEDAFSPFDVTLANDDLRVDGRRSNAGNGGFYGLSSTGEVQATVDVPRTGEYRVRIEAQADQAGGEVARMEFRVDGDTRKTFDVRGERKPEFYETNVRLSRGRNQLAARFVNDFYDPDAADPGERDRNLYVRSFELRGVSGPNLDQLRETHRRLVPVRPDDVVTVRDAAFHVLRPFARRAFRRPVDDEELEKYVGLVELVIENGDSFERGVQIALQGILVSPHFLFRIEGDVQPGEERRLDDWELATRLSYFLWSTMPDAELFELAEKGRLHQPDVLEDQVRRMLADGRSRALVENFGGQWLNLGQLEGIRPDPELFAGFDDRLKQDMERETLAFFEWIMRQDRSVGDFLDAKTTFLNERLAKHYGIDGVRGDLLREVSLEGQPRAGVLTQGSILLLTSNPTRTSPVKRGKWIMENMLGTPPPEAPPNVPTLEESAEANPGASLREQLELHRKDPVCRSCHEQMDALGFGFETFDAIGRYRTKDDGHDVDPSGVLPSGERFSGPIELIAVLKTKRELFVRNLARKMLTYALGRGLEYYDDCAVEDVTKHLAANDHRFSELVLAVVKSDPFLKRRGADQ